MLSSGDKSLYLLTRNKKATNTSRDEESSYVVTNDKAKRKKAINTLLSSGDQSTYKIYKFDADDAVAEEESGISPLHYL